jgi:hypothetical protein
MMDTMMTKQRTPRIAPTWAVWVIILGAASCTGLYAWAGAAKPPSTIPFIDGSQAAQTPCVNVAPDDNGRPPSVSGKFGSACVGYYISKYYSRIYYRAMDQSTLVSTDTAKFYVYPVDISYAHDGQYVYHGGLEVTGVTPVGFTPRPD